MREASGRRSVDPSEYDFPTVAEFEARAGSRHAWLNGSIFIATGAREVSSVVLRFFELQ